MFYGGWRQQGGVQSRARQCNLEPREGGIVTWEDVIVSCLKRNDLRLIAYVPDAVVWKVLGKLEGDPFFTLVPAAREEETLGIVAGAYAARMRGAVFMQSSGIVNSINAIGSLCIPFRIPLPMFITLRGDLGESNIAQIAPGKVVRPTLQALGLQSFILRREDELERTTNGAIELCYTAREPVGLLLSTLLTGDKSGTS